MKLGLLNDTHLGITTDGQLRLCFRRLADKKPDLIIHAGDYCGGTVGNRTLRVTCELLRAQFPTTPIVSVIGNHDFWSNERSPEGYFHQNYEMIKLHFKNHKIHFLDEDGIFRMNGLTILGCSGWYHTKPKSNDWKFIPKNIEGDTHSYLLKRAYNILDRNLADLKDEDHNRIFVSHFPVMDCNPCDGNPHTGEFLEKEYGFKYFISGHSHGLKLGPKHFRTGTHYGLPQFEVLEIGGAVGN